jgi:D-apionolactonase
VIGKSTVHQPQRIRAFTDHRSRITDYENLPITASKEPTMKAPDVSRAVKLCGTEQPDVVGQILTAGPLTAELDNGNLRYLRVRGVEVLRALAYLVRDENWGTYISTLSGLKVEQRADSFSVTYSATCRRGDMEIAYQAGIEGRPDGSLEFTGTATPKTDFLTARTGFVVLHPLKGVAGQPVEIEHVDGKVEKSKFPPLVDPVQPFLLIRALTHEVLPGLKATVHMDGDAWEMEDHRNWSDASFKTYVRPLTLPWPYTLKAGEPVNQSVMLKLSGATPTPVKGARAKTVEVKVGAATRQNMPAVGLGMPAEEIDHAIARLDLLKLVAPKLLICHFDPRQRHGRRELYGYRVLCEQTGADCELEVVVESVDKFKEELTGLASMVREAGLKLSAVAVCPAGDLKSVLPGGPRPPAPPLEALYRAAREAFPGVKLGGGMFSFFTELNRKRPPAQLLDFVHNSTCPIVHAADDRSVMETHEALPYQVATARSFIGKTPHRIGPSAIACRDNPHGKTFTPNPNNERICLVQMDPRQRGLFGAAWTLGYIASFAPTGVEAISTGAPTGPLGIVFRKTDTKQPYYDQLSGTAVYPAFHVVAGLTRASGMKLVSATSSDDATVRCLAYKAKGATLLWLANLTAQDQTVAIAHEGGAMFAALLDETSFGKATTDPIGFETSYKPLAAPRLTLKAYGVGIVCINDR